MKFIVSTTGFVFNVENCRFIGIEEEATYTTTRSYIVMIDRSKLIEFRGYDKKILASRALEIIINWLKNSNENVLDLREKFSHFKNQMYEE